MVQLEQILKVKEQVQAEYRINETLHAEFIEFDIVEKKDNSKDYVLKVKDSMGWMTIETLKWLDDKYGAGVVFAGDFRTGEQIPYVLVE